MFFEEGEHWGSAFGNEVYSFSSESLYSFSSAIIQRLWSTSSTMLE
jgi:hypothetical protein